MLHFFGLNVKLLKFAGVWVYEDQLSILNVYNVICIFYSMIFFTFSQIISLKDSRKAKIDLIRNINMTTSFVLSLYKLTKWFLWRKEILSIMKTLSDTSIFDFYNKKKIIETNKKVKDNLIKIFHSLSIAVSSICFLTRLFQIIFNEEYNQELPYQSWIPFEYKSSKFQHMLAVFMQCLALFNCGSITVGLDMLYTALVMLTTVHFKLLREAFKNIQKKVLNDLKIKHEDEKFIKKCEDELKKLIQHLQVVLKICDDLETIYSSLIFAQLLVSLVVLCTCMFLVTTVPIGSIGNDLAYFLAIENQLALYCYTGNELTLNAISLPNSLFHSDWIHLSKQFKHNLRFTIMRMSKPVYLTIGKFSPLTLQTFVTIGRASYSLLAIIKR
ncbi:odorant receptor 4-like isoform X1 [Onthophagus taurus]|uniref:odorant receptor 4-like isoform X1 n=1 Tax=Onthophagus taurus TaxID=166361 RepID=UPI000C201FA1|nr:odorant receptor 4-like [Onthophagus taurus]